MNPLVQEMLEQVAWSEIALTVSFNIKINGAFSNELTDDMCSDTMSVAALNSLSHLKSSSLTRYPIACYNPVKRMP